jgi:hypothetical protein
MAESSESQHYYSPADGMHHIEDGCPLGRRIPLELRRPGTGGLELCPACRARLAARQSSLPASG